MIDFPFHVPGLSKMRRWLLAILLMVGSGAVCAAFTAISPRSADLSGRWQVNTALSDDAEQLLQKRLEEDRQQRAKLMRRMRNEGAIFLPPDPDDDSPNAPDAPEAQPSGPGPQQMAQRQERFRRRDDELRKMLGISPTLEIKQSGTTLDMRSQVDVRRFEAGSRSQVSMPQGELADSQVGWDGEWFTIERKARGGPRVVEKYRWLKKTDQLESLLAWSGESPLAGIKVHRIYDRVAGSAAPPDPAQGPVK